MGRTIFVEIDDITFTNIKKGFSNGKVKLDEQKFFRNLKEGDSVVFNSKGRKIEGFIKNIKIYDNIKEYLSVNNLSALILDCKNPMEVIKIMENKDNKKVRFYEIDYHPYGEDDKEEDNDDKQNNFFNILDLIMSGNPPYEDDNID